MDWWANTSWVNSRSHELNMLQIQSKAFAKPLQRGDEVTTVAASSAITDDQALLNGVSKCSSVE